MSVHVSIHAPTRGATTRTRPLPSVICFNPRPHAGGDHLSGLGVDVFGFQSTPPRGGRLGTVIKDAGGTPGFNPRPHAGGDKLDDGPSWECMFQSTPPRGGRLSWQRKPAYWTVSIHAPTRGATTAQTQRRSSCRVSIHAPTRGATLSPTYPPHLSLFQSTPPRGGRRAMTPFVCAGQRFNPRPHAGGDSA